MTKPGPRSKVPPAWALPGNKLGSNTKWKAGNMELVREMCAAGMTRREICDALEISEVTFFNWQVRIPGFKEVVQLGRKVSNARVEDALYHRAIGFSHKSEKLFLHEGAVIRAETVEQYPPDTTAALQWLQNRSPKWKKTKDAGNTVAPEVSADELFRKLTQGSPAEPPTGEAGEPESS